VVAAGLANQGETTMAWDADSGEPLSGAVSWQCRRSESVVRELADAGFGPEVRRRTGLPLDAYYSAGKMTWLLRNEPAVAHAARDERLRLGTVDAWLIARLDGSALTDPSTASRTQLFGLDRGDWDPWLLDRFGVAERWLPPIAPTAGELATLRHRSWPVELPLRAAACDQQAALAGNAGLTPGAAKVTYGTGAFLVADAGTDVPPSRVLEVSVAWRLGMAPMVYVLQGGVLSAGSVGSWLEQGLGLSGAADLGRLAASAPDAGGVRMLPALGGIGAPWYRPDARGVLAGLTAATRPGNLARALIDAICHRVCDLVDALAESGRPCPDVLRADGGLTRVDTLMQRQADLLGVPVAVVDDPESTSRGIALLAAVGAGLRGAGANRPAAVARTFEPRLDPGRREADRSSWRSFVTAASAL
jgi:glycerol kinase